MIENTSRVKDDNDINDIWRLTHWGKNVQKTKEVVSAQQRYKSTEENTTVKVESGESLSERTPVFTFLG